jgi:hypothetical protein
MGRQRNVPALATKLLPRCWCLYALPIAPTGARLLPDGTFRTDLQLTRSASLLLTRARSTQLVTALPIHAWTVRSIAVARSGNAHQAPTAARIRFAAGTPARTVIAVAAPSAA